MARGNKRAAGPTLVRTPMSIHYVHIKNFRGHKDETLAFDMHHALVGENGVGKTSLLDAVRLACSPSFAASRLCEQDFNNADTGPIQIKVVFHSYFVCSVRDGYRQYRVPCNAVVLTAKRRERPTSGKALCDPFVTESYCVPVEYTDTKDFPEAKLPEGITKHKIVQAVAKYKEGEEDGFALRTQPDTTYKTPATEFTLRDAEGFPNVFMFDRDREQQTETGFKSVVTRVITELNWRVRHSVELGQLRSSWESFHQVVYDAAGKRYSEDLVGPVQEMLREAIGKGADGLELSPLRVEEPFRRAFFSVREGTNQVDLDGMGSGISMLFALLLLEHVSRLSKQDCIFLIDEPEMHLHPQLQAYVGRRLRGNGFQTIVSTHSPYFVDLGAWRSTTRCHAGGLAPRKDALGTLIEGKPLRDHLDEVAKWKYHETLFTLGDADILFSRRVVLTEGPAEKYGLPRLASKLNANWNELTFIGCNGKTKIAHYALLCRAYGIPTFVIFDLDQGKPNADKATQLVEKYIGDFPRSTFTRSFEACFNVGSNADHKASEVLLAIDECKTRADIPGEVLKAVDAITSWLDPARASNGGERRSEGDGVQPCAT